MTFGKKQKQAKTQYENENQDIGRNAYTQMQPALDRIGDLTMNPDDYRQKMINTYYNTDNSAQWSDAQRNALRTLSNATAHNYAATHGGYSSAGDRYYDDTQRAVNDYNARLWDRGVQSGNAMYQQDLGNTQNYYRTLLGTHDLAKAPDAIDAYNQQLDEANKTWWTEPLAQVGNAVEQFAPGWWKAIGTGMKMGANAASKDYSDSLARLSGQFGGTSDPTAFKSSATDFGGLMSSGANNWMNWGGLQGASYQGGGKLGQKISNAVYSNNPTKDKDGLIHYVQNGVKMVYDPNDPNKPAIRE